MLAHSVWAIYWPRAHQCPQEGTSRPQQSHLPPRRHPLRRREVGAAPRYANTASPGFFFVVWARKEKKETGAAGAVSAVRRRRAPQGASGHRRRALYQTLRHAHHARQLTYLAARVKKRNLRRRRCKVSDVGCRKALWINTRERDYILAHTPHTRKLTEIGRAALFSNRSRISKKLMRTLLV